MSHEFGYKRRKSGFTLVEVVIYIGLFGILMTGGIVATYQLLQGGAHNETAINIQEEADHQISKFGFSQHG